MVDDGRLTVDYGTYHCHIMFRFDTYVQIVLDTHSTEQQSYNLSCPGFVSSYGERQEATANSHF